MLVMGRQVLKQMTCFTASMESRFEGVSSSDVWCDLPILQFKVTFRETRWGFSSSDTLVRRNPSQ